MQITLINNFLEYVKLCKSINDQFTFKDLKKTVTEMKQYFDDKCIFDESICELFQNTVHILYEDKLIDSN
jgi:hypothetical protein